MLKQDPLHPWRGPPHPISWELQGLTGAWWSRQPQFPWKQGFAELFGQSCVTGHASTAQGSSPFSSTLLSQVSVHRVLRGPYLPWNLPLGAAPPNAQQCPVPLAAPSLRSRPRWLCLQLPPAITAGVRFLQPHDSAHSYPGRSERRRGTGASGTHFAFGPRLLFRSLG